jgi:sugar phosphate isomerase/epimerase
MDSRTFNKMAIRLLGVGALSIAAGCASNPPEPDEAALQEQLTQAEATVRQAEENGAYESGSASFESARDKLDEARERAADGDRGVAARLAQEAELDAELALAMAQNQEMQDAAAEMRDSIRTLREETQREN